MSGDAPAQSVADLSQRKAFLLGVCQVGLGEHGAAGGDLRCLARAASGDGGELRGAGEIQASRLLVEEAAGPGRAAGIGLVAGVAAGLVE